MITSRQLVKQTLDFAAPSRVPRQLWYLPWAENHYPVELDRVALAEYDATMQHYYASRSSHAKQQNWSGQIRAILGKESRPFMLAYLQGQGFITR